MFPRGAGGSKWSLGPTETLLRYLGDPHHHFDSIHVGGTNGKGSVCALLAAALRQSGWRVGLYSSPHLVDVRERMMVDGRPITEEAFASWTSRLQAPVEESGASFFEATTAIAFADFAARGIDIAVVEVGLGGRLDSTNVIRPLVSVVTQVGLDHTEYLGNTLEAIAVEKAGIAKPGTPFIVGERNPSLAELLATTAASLGASAQRVPVGMQYEGRLALAGAHQRRNAAIAQATLASLPAKYQMSAAALESAFATTTLRGRFERYGKWIFDVAHNPDGIEALAGTLQETAVRRPLHALVGILKDKDWRGMLARLVPLVDRLWITAPPSAPPDRRWDLGEVPGAVPADVAVEPEFGRALEAVQAGAGTVLVTGSFHTVGDAMARLPGLAPLA